MKERMYAYFEAYNQGDYANVVASYYTEDVVFETPELRFVGAEEVTNFFVRSHESVTETLKPVILLTEADNVAAALEVTIRVFKDSPDFHIRPVKAGDVIVLDFAVFYKLKGDRISHIKVYRFKT